MQEQINLEELEKAEGEGIDRSQPKFSGIS